MGEKWGVGTDKHGAMVAVLPNSSGKTGKFVKAAGSTVTSGTYLKGANNAWEFRPTWGLSILGATQVKHGDGKPTPRLAEFVLDLFGMVEYRKAKPKTYPKKA